MAVWVVAVWVTASLGSGSLGCVVAPVLAEISWPETDYQAQARMVRQNYRILKMSYKRLTKRIYYWERSFSDVNYVATWSSELRLILSYNKLEEHTDLEPGLSFAF